MAMVGVVTALFENGCHIGKILPQLALVNDDMHIATSFILIF